MNIIQYAQGVLVVSGDSSKKLSKPLKTFNPSLDELPLNPFGVGTQDAINTGILADSADLGESKQPVAQPVSTTTEEPVEEPVPETTEEPVEEPVPETTEEPVEEPAPETTETK